MAHNNNSVNWPQYLQQQANQQQQQQQRLLQQQEHPTLQQQRLLHQQQEQQRLLHQQHEQQKLYQQQKQYQQQHHQDVKHHQQQPITVPTQRDQNQQQPQQFFPATIDLTQIYEPVSENETDADISRRIMMIDHLLTTYGGDNPRGQADFEMPVQQQPQPQQQQALAAATNNYQAKYKSKRGRRPKYCPSTPSTNVNISMDMPTSAYNTQNQPFIPTVNNINVQTQNFNLPIFPQPVNYPYANHLPKTNSVKITEIPTEPQNNAKSLEPPIKSPNETIVKTELIDSESDALVIDEDRKPEINAEELKADQIDEVRQANGIPSTSAVKTEECNNHQQKRPRLEYPELARNPRRIAQEPVQTPSLQDILNRSISSTVTSAQAQLNMINRTNIVEFVKTGQQIIIELIQHCEEIHKIFKANANLADNQMKVQTHLRCIRLLTQNVQLVYRKCCESSAILEFGNLDEALMNRLLSFAETRHGEDLCAGFDERFRARMQLLMRNTELREMVEKLKVMISEFNARHRE